MTFYKLDGWPRENSVYGKFPEWANTVPRKWSDSIDLETTYCSRNKDHIQNRWPRKLVLKGAVPKTGDMVWTWYSNLLVSDRLREMLHSLDPALEFELVQFEKHVPGDRELFHVIAPEKVGWADPSSKMRLRSECPVCGIRYFTKPRGPLGVIPEKYDGAAVFHFEEYPWIFIISEPVKKLIEENKFKHCGIGRLEDWSPMD